MNSNRQSASSPGPRAGVASHQHGAWAAALALVAGLAGCGGGDDAAPAAPPTSVAATIGAAGGTVEGPDGARVVIPAGALTTDTLITVARRDAGAPGSDPWGATRSGPLYEFTPHDLNFALPVTIRIPAAAVGSAADHGVFRASPLVDHWQEVDATLTSGYAEWPSRSFSWYGATACAIAAGNPDPYPCARPAGNTTLSATPAGAVTLLADYTGTSYHRVREAVSLQLDARYSGPADCQDPRIEVRRVRRNQPGSTHEVLGTMTLSIGASTNPAYVVYSGSYSVALTAADNGSDATATALISAFSCRRGYQTPARASLPLEQQRIGTHDAFVFDALIPDTPAPVAAPTITQQPVDLSVTAGQTTSFLVAASAPDNLSFIWERSNDGGTTWQALAGETAASLSFSAAAGDNGARLRARVCNTRGSEPPNCLASASATLTVTTAPPAAWSAPVAVNTTPQSTFEPAVAFTRGASPVALAVWGQVRAGGSPTIDFSRREADGSWRAPVSIQGSLVDAYSPRIAGNDAGRAAAAWGYLVGGRYRIGANLYDGTAWGTAEPLDTGAIGNSGDPRVAIDDQGRALALWTQFNGSVFSLWASVNDGGAWQPPIQIDRDLPGGSGEVSVAMDGPGNATITWVQSGAARATSFSFGVGFQTPQTLSDTNTVSAYRTVLAGLDANGNTLTAWLQDRPTGGYDLAISRRSAGIWSAPTVIEPNAGFATLTASIDAGGNAHVAWTQRTAGQQRTAIWTRHCAPGSIGCGPAQSLSLADFGSQAPRLAAAGSRSVLLWSELGTDLVTRPRAATWQAGSWSAVQTLGGDGVRNTDTALGASPAGAVAAWTLLDAPGALQAAFLP